MLGDDQAVHVWSICDFAFGELLSTPLKPSTIATTIAVIVLDLSEPWNLARQLDKWTNLLERQCLEVMSNLPQEQQKSLKQAQVLFHKAFNDTAATEASAEHSAEDQDTASNVDLEAGVLSANIHIPIVVVCSYPEKLESISRSASLAADHFDFIQATLRVRCRKFGAALVYASPDTGSNCDTLLRYLLHRLHSSRFRLQGQAKVLGLESIFIPAGWDTNDRISSLIGESPKFALGTPFQEVIKKVSCNIQVLHPSHQWIPLPLILAQPTFFALTHARIFHPNSR